MSLLGSLFGTSQEQQYIMAMEAVRRAEVERRTEIEIKKQAAWLEERDRIPHYDDLMKKEYGR
jgi:uncharacterized protein YecT (DUF1311 family)